MVGATRTRAVHRRTSGEGVPRHVHQQGSVCLAGSHELRTQMELAGICFVMQAGCDVSTVLTGACFPCVEGEEGFSG